MCKPGAIRRFRRPGETLVALAMLAALAGCGHQQAPMSADKEAAQYLARAKHDYRPPGPPGDPWGPYIVEAAAKYDVPETWVRGVIRQESGGRLYENGKLITSSAGAMGLMQVMPGTFDELRARYNLGDDPFDPHDNIMAGTAYIRELYDLYGSPGFLAAYNAGPKRLDDYLSHNRPLPDETRHYVARIGPNIAGAYPQRLSPASQYAMNQLPVNIPPGPRYPKTRAQAPVALAANTRRSNGWTKNDVQMASLPAPPAAAPQPMLQLASAQSMPDTPPKPPGSGFHIIPRAMAETMPVTRGGPVSGNWAIQVGAYASESQARSAAVAAKTQTTVLASAQPVVGTVRQSKATLYRARLTGLSRDAAVQACEKISHHGNCIVVSPDAQS